MTNRIIDLPSDEIPPTNDEMNVMTWMFPKEKEKESVEIQRSSLDATSTMPLTITPSFKMDIRTMSIILILYIIFHMKWMDHSLKKFVPFFRTNAVLYLISKGIVFCVLLYYIWNICYIKKGG